MMSIQLTKEQEDIINYVKSNPTEDVKIIARAGAGKTYILSQIAKEFSNKKILYIAFNKAIVEDAKTKFPKNVEIRTIHSMAYQYVGRKFKNRLSYNFDIFQFKDLFNLDFNYLSFILAIVKEWLNTEYKVNDKKQIKGIIKRLVKNYDRKALGLEGDVTNKFMDYFYKYFKMFWEEISSEYSTIKIIHDVYLKIFQLNFNRYKVKDKYDRILVDEFHDISPVMLDIINKFNCPKVVVGDECQHIYSFRGAINGFERFKADKVFYLTYTFRFADKDKLNIINDYLINCLNVDKGTEVKTFFKKIEKDCETSCYLTRLNSTVIELIDKKDLKTVRHPEVFFKSIDLLLDRKYKIPYSEDFGKLNLYQYLKAVREFAKFVFDREIISSANLILKKSKKVKNIYQYFSDLKEKAISIYYSNCQDYVGTAHSCKGLEFDEVIIMKDFPIMQELFQDLFVKGKIKADAVYQIKKENLCKYLLRSRKVREELNLLYVAFTRFKVQIDIPEVYQLKDEYVIKTNSVGVIGVGDNIEEQEGEIDEDFII